MLEWREETRKITYDENIRVADIKYTFGDIRGIVEQHVRTHYDVPINAEINVTHGVGMIYTVTITEVVKDD